MRGARVFDSRPHSLDCAPRLLQHFLGLHVRTRAPVFEPSTVTLMDFDVPQSEGIHFFYVLPYTKTSALVEATFISDARSGHDVYVAAVENYMHERFGCATFDACRIESGAIPMEARAQTARKGRRVYRLGTAGGLVKPSTGYAFLAIQRWTQEFAERLSKRPLPEPPPVQTLTSRILDGIFLSFLRAHPERAPEIFVGLFGRVPADPLVRFLTDTATARDRAQVVAAMPTADFVREAWRSRREWLT